MTNRDSDSRIAADWWRGLQPNHQNGARNPLGDRAALARLRRADIMAAMQDAATFDLFRALGRTSPDDLPEVALCAAVLACVRDDDRSLHAARQLGVRPGEPEERAVMSVLRLRRLIGADTVQERLTAFRRAIALARARINVREFAAACLDWSESRRRRWIFEYYAAGSSAPPAEPASEETPA